MDSLLGPTIIGYNYPINVYPAGNYGYTVKAEEGGAAARADAAPQVTVNYPAGLGTSVSANFKAGTNNVNNITGSTATTVSFNSGQSGSTLTLGLATGSNTLVAQNGVLNNNQTTADANLYLTIPGTSITDATGTLTLTPNSTRPQSVWYTVSASGQIADGSTAITQASYDLTKDENNNIFAVSANKIPGATNTGFGGYGYGMGNDINNSSSLNTSKTYTTTTCGNQNGVVNNTINTTYGQPFAALNTSLKTGAPEGQNTITLSQNYLPLGITANVKDAYFNHNGII